MTDYSILFVCTANRCRSPMAEGIWRQHISNLGETDRWRIGSAGTWTADGHPAMPLTKKVLFERGINMASHESREIKRSLIDDYALILVMEQGHKEALQAEFMEYGERIFLLSEMAVQHYSIEDPVAGTLRDYEQTRDEICRLLMDGKDRIRTLAAIDKS